MAVSADPISPRPVPSFSTPTPAVTSATSTTATSTNGSALTTPAAAVFPPEQQQQQTGPDAKEDGLHRDRSPIRGRSKHATSMATKTVSDYGLASRTDGGENTLARHRSSSRAMKKTYSQDSVQKLSAADMQRLTSSPDSLPIAMAPPPRHSLNPGQAAVSSEQRDAIRQSLSLQPDFLYHNISHQGEMAYNASDINAWLAGDPTRPSALAPRPLSTPPTSRIQHMDPPPYSSSPRRFSFQPAPRPQDLHLNFDGANGMANMALPSPSIKMGPPALVTPPIQMEPPGPSRRAASPIPPLIPLPPMSLPTHLQLELAAQRPSPLYIHQPHCNDIPYESHAAKFERLKNVLLIPPYLERTLNFGAVACLDAWLYTFTILPIRFVFALGVLVRWWAYLLAKEIKWLIGYVWTGMGRLWKRGRTGRLRSVSDVSDDSRSRSCSRASERSIDGAGPPGLRQRPNVSRVNSRVRGGEESKSSQKKRNPGPKSGTFRHRRTKSVASSLSAFHKADLLQGAVIICSSLALMRLDASRMYHFIRAQSAIKLYVVYNILEVSDRLLSALGQDILECLFSTETLSRNASGRSKVLLPLGMFLLALLYCCLHSIALYYQVITLNVAVNSYSNALLTLLLSNQFVEIKSTVFKRFEKDNLFQLTCADIVERFHLWIMLLIIGMRNFVEVGGLSIPGAGGDEMGDSGSSRAEPLHPPSILPHSFTVLPSWLMSGEVLSPFLIVIGSEMLVDTIKHAYVTKFNNIKPNFYSRTLDILCKDYYTNAFTSPSLTRRLGLAVIPLSCLFIRASVQTYNMFIAVHVPMPFPPSTQTSLTEESAVPTSPAIIAALNRFDSLIRDSLGRATYGNLYGSLRSWYSWTSDDVIASVTMLVVFFIIFLVLLILKLLLGMVLLKYARNRYAKMKQKENLVAHGKAEQNNYDATGRRVGGFGHVEVGEDRQRWIQADKSEGLKGGKGSGKRAGFDDKAAKPESDYQGVFRYEMVAKRIW